MMSACIYKPPSKNRNQLGFGRRQGLEDPHEDKIELFNMCFLSKSENRRSFVLEKGYPRQRRDEKTDEDEEEEENWKTVQINRL